LLLQGAEAMGIPDGKQLKKLVALALVRQ
jgi:hypothetical protein